MEFSHKPVCLFDPVNLKSALKSSPISGFTSPVLYFLSVATTPYLTCKEPLFSKTIVWVMKQGLFFLSQPLKNKDVMEYSCTKGGK